jgi:hypothetical protein
MALRFRYFEDYDDDKLPYGARYRNPFNHMNSHSGSSFIKKQDVPALRAELKRRDLPETGSKSELVHRLLENNMWIFTSDGMKERYERRLADFQRSTCTHIVPFTRFPDLPTELRHLIWEHTLPGARILNASTEYTDAGGTNFLFCKTDNHPNPIALSICRESRNVALRRYRLCFNTHNVYADLEGGDTLYFGSNCLDIDDLFGKGGTLWKVSPGFIAELKEVTRLGLSNNVWDFYGFDAYRDGVEELGGSVLRKDMEEFPKLKQLYIVGSGSEVHPVLGETPGHTQFLERPAEATQQYNPGSQQLVDDFSRIRKGFEEDVNKTKRQAIPELLLCDANKIPNIPGDDWDWNFGEPYVCSIFLAGHSSTNIGHSIYQRQHGFYRIRGEKVAVI